MFLSTYTIRYSLENIYIYIYIFLDHLLMQMSKGKYFTVFAGGIRDASGSAGLEDDVIRTPIFVSLSLTLKNILRMVSCSRWAGLRLRKPGAKATRGKVLSENKSIESLQEKHRFLLEGVFSWQQSILDGGGRVSYMLYLYKNEHVPLPESVGHYSVLYWPQSFKSPLLLWQLLSVYETPSENEL